VDVVEALKEGPGTGWQQEGPEEGQEKKRKCKVKIYMVAKIAEKPWKESTGGVAKGLDNARG
jgi:hypothetical protein